MESVMIRSMSVCEVEGIWLDGVSLGCCLVFCG